MTSPRRRCPLRVKGTMNPSWMGYRRTHSGFAAGTECAGGLCSRMTPRPRYHDAFNPLSGGPFGVPHACNAHTKAPYRFRRHGK